MNIKNCLLLLTLTQNILAMEHTIIKEINTFQNCYIVKIPFKKDVDLESLKQTKGIKSASLSSTIERNGSIKIKVKKTVSVEDIYKKFARKKEQPWILWVHENYVYLDKKEKYELVDHHDSKKYSLVILPEELKNKNELILNVHVASLAAQTHSSTFGFI